MCLDTHMKLALYKYAIIIIIITYRHYSDVIMGAMASQITGVSIVYSSPYSAQIKENIKAPRHWPLWEEFTGDRWVPLTKGL